MREISKFFRLSKAKFILECIRGGGNTAHDFQDSRDFITRSLMLDLEHQKEILIQLDKKIKKVLLSFDYRLTSMPGIGTALASKLIAEIGDIADFPLQMSWQDMQELLLSSSVRQAKERSKALVREIVSCMGCFISLRSQWYPYRNQESQIIRYSTVILCEKSAKARPSLRHWSVLCVVWSISSMG